MRISVLLLFALIVVSTAACKKRQSLPASNIPNGDFESWTSIDELQQWKTNSCPVCVPPFETYVVQKTTEAYHGQYAAKFIYNGVFNATATDKFVVTSHPSALIGYAKGLLVEGDTVSIKVRVFSSNTVVDSGEWIDTETIPLYRKFTIPITQSTATADSVQVSVKGGHKFNTQQSTALWLDYLSLQ